MEPLTESPVEALVRAGGTRGRWIEMLALFGVAPVVLAVFMRGWLVFPAIWLLGAICLASLLTDRAFERRRLWNARAALGGLWRMGACYALSATLLGVLLWLIDPARLWSLPRDRPALWGVIMLAYPILSVYPQEVAFRAFFHHRYRPLLGEGTAMTLAGAAAFGAAHVIMHNWIAVAFSAVGGILFARTYLRTRSLLACWIEHSLYGCTLFTIGWGSYFYGGGFGR